MKDPIVKRAFRLRVKEERRMKAVEAEQAEAWERRQKRIRWLARYREARASGIPAENAREIADRESDKAPGA